MFLRLLEFIVAFFLTLTPGYVSGGSAGNHNAAMQMMDLIGIKAAKDLGIDMSMRGGNSTK